MDPEHTQPCPDHWEREVAPSPDWELFTVNSPPVSAGSMVGVSTQQRWPCTGYAPASAAERFPPKQEPTQDPPAAPAREGLSQAPRGPTGTIRGDPVGSPVHPIRVSALPCPSQLGSPRVPGKDTMMFQGPRRSQLGQKPL